jgi:adenylyltransferase/sulfurtransferase
MSDRNQRLEELGWKASVLGSKRVLVVGAGAIGNEVIKNLALIGVGQVQIADMDSIESHNLTRSVLFRETDVGHQKAEVAACRAMEINRATTAIPLAGYVQNRLGLGAFRRFDAVFGCLDNFQTRRDLNRWCLQTGTLFVDGGLHFLDGEVRCFGDAFDVCFDCTLTDEIRQRAFKRFSCLQLLANKGGDSVPTAPTISAMVAGLMVQLAVKHFHGMRIPLGEAIVYQGGIDDPYRTRYQRNEACPTHGQYHAIGETKVVELQRTSRDLTLQELVAEVRCRLGKRAILRTDFELVESFRCRRCGTEEEVFKQRGLIHFDEAVCRRCEQETDLDLVDLLRTPRDRYEFTGEEEYAGQTLEDLGFPPLGIYQGSAGDRQLLVEISGDEERIFRVRNEEAAVD